MKATIILPTTGDRGGILKYSVGSVLNQTEQDWELFIIGDGLDEASQETAKAIAAGDRRIQFFSYPKSSSRGELHRHEILSTHAKGEIVCYLCDRDLYLENHLEVMHSLLQGCDLGYSLPTYISRQGVITILGDILNQKHERQREFCRQRCASFGLSIAAHRLDAYKKLPHGWRETPSCLYTDAYMWEQFFEQEWLRFDIIHEPTVVFVPRNGHLGLPTSERIKESRAFHERYCSQGGLDAFRRGMFRELYEELAGESFAKFKQDQKPRKWYRLGF